jgi:hypothetical protein
MAEILTDLVLTDLTGVETPGTGGRFPWSGVGRVDQRSRLVPDGKGTGRAARNRDLDAG